MGGERWLVHRELQTLPIGTRVRLTSGRTGTLVALTFTSATVKIDSGQPPDRRANSRGEVEIAPAAEVDLVEEQAVVPAPSTDPLEEARAPAAEPEPVAVEREHPDDLARTLPKEGPFSTEADESGPGTSSPAPAMRHAAGGRLLGPTGGRDASEPPLERGASREPASSASACAACGAPTDPRRPWGRYCSHRCRQRAYATRQRGARDASPPG